ncbi:MAG: permease-like cell division protein FtsX, partial [bacterium]|nr:permease-like cell division protein FtsX [bacterium]
VQELTYADKEQAKAAFNELNKNDAELLAATSDIGNPFARYIQIKPKEPGQLAAINAYALDPKFAALVDTTSFENTKVAVDSYINFSKFVMKNSLVFAAFLAIVSVVVVMNIIRVAIYSRREEIGIMRMVGASHQLIRLPFVVEGLLFGAFAAVISLCLLLAVASWEGKQIPLYFEFSTLQPVLIYKQYFGILLWSNFGLGMLLSAIISYVAVRRYLKQ